MGIEVGVAAAVGAFDESSSGSSEKIMCVRFDPPFDLFLCLVRVSVFFRPSSSHTSLVTCGELGDGDGRVKEPSS